MQKQKSSRKIRGTSGDTVQCNESSIRRVSYVWVLGRLVHAAWQTAASLLSAWGVSHYRETQQSTRLHHQSLSVQQPSAALSASPSTDVNKTLSSRPGLYLECSDWGCNGRAGGPFHSPPLEVGPKNLARGSGEPQPTNDLVHFSLKI